LLGEILLKTWSVAVFAPPAVAKISKLVSTWVPLIDTFSMRWPAAPSKISANFRVTW